MLSVGENNFSQQVLESPVPVLVNFWTPWCGLCSKINPLLLKLQSELRGQITVLRVNPDENFKLANTYRLASLPTLLIFHKGALVGRIEGFQGQEDWRTRLENAIAHLSPMNVKRNMEESVSENLTAILGR